MKKIIATFALFAINTGIYDAVDASIFQTLKNVGSKTVGAVKTTARAVGATKNVFNHYVGSKVGNLIHKRGNDNNTKNLENLSYYMKQFQTNISSSASTQLSYIIKQFPVSDGDLSLLTAYYSFAKNCEALFSIVEPVISKIRTDQATIIGGSVEAQEAEVTLQHSIQMLLSNGIKAQQAVLQSSAITLLMTIQRLSSDGGEPDTNPVTMNKQIGALASTSLFGSISLLTTSMTNILDSNDNYSQIDSLVKDILLIQNVLITLQSYINGGNVSGQIQTILQGCKYYSGTTRRTVKTLSNDEEDDDAIINSDSEDEETDSEDDDGRTLGDSEDEEDEIDVDPYE